MHLLGRKGNYNPHLHFIWMNGAIDIKTREWFNLPFFPYEKLRHKWRDFLLKMVEELDDSLEIKKLVKKVKEDHAKEGFVFRIDKRCSKKKKKN